MGNNLPISFGDLRVIPGDPEPRVQDLRLAERLEFKRLNYIRELIERNLVLLERAGSLPRRTVTPVGGGPSGNEYWLNERQAVIVCMLSRTPRSDDVKLELSSIFQAWRHGELAHVSEVPTISGAIRDLYEREVKPVVQRIDDGIVRIISKLEDIVPRRSFPVGILRQYQHTVRASPCFMGKCPCGCGIQILDENGNLLKNCHADHWYGPQRIGPFDGWYVDENCNQLLRDTEYRNKKTNRYAVFHEERRKFFPNDQFKSKTIKRSVTSRSPDQFKLL